MTFGPATAATPLGAARVTQSIVIEIGLLVMGYFSIGADSSLWILTLVSGECGLQ
jgi:hypothetical protein